MRKLCFIPLCFQRVKGNKETSRGGRNPSIKILFNIYVNIWTPHNESKPSLEMGPIQSTPTTRCGAHIK